MYDVIIIGGGPAAISAGIYIARKKIKALIIVKDWGGQMAYAPLIRNYPGLDNITGMDLNNKFEVKRKLSRQIGLGAKAHHNFHVLSVWKQVNDIDSVQTLNAMDLCRISWGRVKKAKKLSLKVEYQPLVFNGNKLDLGELILQKVSYRIKDKGFIKKPKIGDWVSIHWGFVCEVVEMSAQK